MANRITKKDAILILREIETGHGGIADLATQKPFITSISQEWLSRNIGNSFPVFRSVAPVGKLKQETIVSTTINPKIAINLLDDVPIFLTHSKTIIPKRNLLRYDITLDNVIAYVPALIGTAEIVLGNVDNKKLRSLRSDEMIPYQHIIQTGYDEKEVICNVSALTPISLDFGTGTFNDSNYFMIFRDVLFNKWIDVEDFVKRINSRSSGFYRFSEESKEHLSDFAEQVKKFLGKG